VLERLGRAGRAASLTLAELVAVYLEVHEAESVTTAKLSWLLGKAAPRCVRCVWRLFRRSRCERRLIAPVFSSI
jgi:hypothetical protein